MSKSSNGDGKTILAVREALEKHAAGSALRDEALHAVRELMKDPLRFRRNLDLPTAEALLPYAEEMMDPGEKEIAEGAHRDHSKQDTNLKHSWFGQWRKVRSDGTVSVQPLSDVADKFRARMTQDVGLDWTAEEMVSYRERGQNPPAEFWELPLEAKTAWLIGRPLRPAPGRPAEPGLDTLWDPPPPVVVPVLERAGRPATDEDIAGDTWGAHSAAVSMGIRLDLGGKDKLSLMARKLGTVETEIAARGLAVLGKYRAFLQSRADQHRKGFAGGPGEQAAAAIRALLSFMAQPPPEDFVDEFAVHPSSARHRAQFREQLEKLRAGSQKRIARRLEEMLRRCPKAA